MANQFLTAWDNMKKKQAALADTSSAPKPQKQTTFDDIYKTISNFDGEQTKYDPLYDAVKGLENGGRDYNAVYKAMRDIGGEDTMYDPVYDFVKNLENNQPDMGKAETSVTGRPSEMNPSTKPTTPTVSSAVASAMAKLQELRKKTYTDPYGDDLNRMIEEFNNRKAFDYQLNTDQLFLNAREQYMQQGQKAMRDAMGAAATMTGGYGNSYASQVGNQAYQQYLQELNNSIPDFYSSALDKYNAEGQQMLGKINLKDAQRKDDYAMWEAQYLRDLENAALDYDMAVADEQEKALQGTTAWDRLSDEDKMKYTLEYAKLGLNPDGSPLTYTDADGNVVASPVGTIDKSKLNTELKTLTELYKTEGEMATIAYADQLKSLGYSAIQIDEHLNNLDQYGYEDMFSSLSKPVDGNSWTVIDMGGGDLFAGAINDNKKLRNTKTGETYSLADIKSKLLEQGYTKAEVHNLLKQWNEAYYGGDVKIYNSNDNKTHTVSGKDTATLTSGGWKATTDEEGVALFIDPSTGVGYYRHELIEILKKMGYNAPSAEWIINTKY